MASHPAQEAGQLLGAPLHHLRPARHLGRAHPESDPRWKTTQSRLQCEEIRGGLQVTSTIQQEATERLLHPEAIKEPPADRQRPSTFSSGVGTLESSRVRMRSQRTSRSRRAQVEPKWLPSSSVCLLLVLLVSLPRSPPSLAFRGSDCAERRTTCRYKQQPEQRCTVRSKPQAPH